MFIASKNKNQLINVSKLDAMFVNFGNNRIIGQGGGRHMVIDDYKTHQDAEIAMEIVINRIIANKGNGVVCMPTDEEVDIKQRNVGMQVDRYQHGKKTKGHGGS